MEKLTVTSETEFRKGKPYRTILNAEVEQENTFSIIPEKALYCGCVVSLPTRSEEWVIVETRGRMQARLLEKSAYFRRSTVSPDDPNVTIEEFEARR